MNYIMNFFNGKKEVSNNNSQNNLNIRRCLSEINVGAIVGCKCNKCYNKDFEYKDKSVLNYLYFHITHTNNQEKIEKGWFKFHNENGPYKYGYHKTEMDNCSICGGYDGCYSGCSCPTCRMYDRHKQPCQCNECKLNYRETQIAEILERKSGWTNTKSNIKSKLLNAKNKLEYAKRDVEKYSKELEKWDILDKQNV